MTDKNALAIYSQFDSIQKAAIALQQSGYFRDVTSQAQAIVKVMAGAELGLPPFAAMSGIHIIQGKPVLGANVIATLVKNDPRYDYRVKVCDAKDCELAWFEDGKQVGTSTFTWDEAKAAGLTDKDNWRKFPSDMLFARAISRGARRFAPGIFGGSPVYTPDEMGVETNEDGYIEGVIKESAPEPPKTDMTLETAENVTNRDGARYGDLDTEKLSHMATSIRKTIDKNGLTPEEKETHQFKLDAALTIIKARNTQPA
jgi:hypothetical protein